MPDTSAITGTTPTAGGTDLTAAAAASNIASAPSIDTLTQLIQGINQKAYLSAPGRSQELGTIQNQLSGNLDPSTIYNAQLRNAQQYGSGGFTSDSQAWQTAVQRGLILDRQAIIGQGQKAMDSFYAGMPTANAQSQMTTPALLEQQQATQADQALKQQQITNQSNQFTAELANKVQEFGVTSAQDAQRIANQASQFAAAQAQQLSEFGTTTGIDQAQFEQNLALQYARLAAQNSLNYGRGYGSGSGTGSSVASPYNSTKTTTTTTGTPGTYPTGSWVAAPDAASGDTSMDPGTFYDTIGGGSFDNNWMDPAWFDSTIGTGP